MEGSSDTFSKVNHRENRSSVFHDSEELLMNKASKNSYPEDDSSVDIMSDVTICDCNSEQSDSLDGDYEPSDGLDDTESEDFINSGS